MKSWLVLADDRRVNLASAVNPEVYAELEATQGRGTRKRPLLFCGGCTGGVYVKHGSIRRDELFGAHFDAGTCAADLTIRKSVMSDEHKRMAEYHVAAAVANGLDADTEVRTTGRTRVDVVVDSRVGFEVQLSKLTAGAAVRRTERSMTAGLEAVAWCAETASVAWMGKVPGYQWLDNGQIQRGLPRPRSVRARGLFTFRSERASRNQWTPVLEPLTVLVDEAVVRMATGNIRPVMYAGNVQLMRADGIKLFEDLTGQHLVPFQGHPPSRGLTPAPEAECLRQPPARVMPEPETAPHVCQEDWCGEPARPYENGTIWLCTGHVWQRNLSRERTT